jgi:hypothetical protein
MDDFSWSDAVKAAFAPCLSCLPNPTRNNEQSHNSTPRAELEGLLADIGETDNEAETLSLHSYFGDRRRKQKRPMKNIKLFGYHVFGKPPIQLDGEDDLRGHSQSSLSSGVGRRKSTTSSSTLDSDAAPLDQSTIDQLSAAQLNERHSADDTERRRKEERRRRRQERKELNRATLALALDREHEEFEGFPGAATATNDDDPTYFESAYRVESFVEGDHLDPDVEGADFEAEMYNIRTGGKSLRSESDSRSSTSASNPVQVYSHHYLSQQPGPVLPPHLIDETPRRKKSKRSKTSSKSSSSKTSQSSSLPSPPNTSFPVQPSIASWDGIEFEGVPHDEMFPIVGFGGGKTRRLNGDLWVALARRGDN